jgi:excisionase family DNA binding protein
MAEQLLSVEDAARRLALRPGTVRKLIYARRLPAVKIGRAVRVREADLSALINFGYRPAVRWDV